MKLPAQGSKREDVIARMREMKTQDADWRGARTWSLIYPAGEEVDELLSAANELYLYENALNPMRFPSLKQMEVDVVRMTAGLLHAPDGFGGSLSSGGTESILLGVKTARERARALAPVDSPEILVPYSAHPAFAKAAHTLGMRHVAVPLAGDKRADVAALRSLVSERTVLIVGSAPNYPFGVIDPIEEMAALALDRGISFHTDACLGGFMLPFWERLGEPVAPFDFRVEGVTTISADVHKYGYCTKGASVILHRERRSLSEYQRFVYSGWPGGMYMTNAMAGARPAAPIASAWAVMQFLGEEGYLRLAEQVRDTTRVLRAGIDAIPALHVNAQPAMSVFSFSSDEVDVFAVGEAMDTRGWCLDRQTDPDALHLMISPAHAQVADAFLADLREAVSDHAEARSRDARYS